jgi:hypothetical protein
MDYGLHNLEKSIILLLNFETCHAKMESNPTVAPEVILANISLPQAIHLIVALYLL